MKTLVILILLFDGTFLKQNIILPAPTEVHDCLNYGEMFKETISTYRQEPYQGWYLNNGRGIIFGIMCE